MIRYPGVCVSTLPLNVAYVLRKNWLRQEDDEMSLLEHMENNESDSEPKIVFLNKSQHTVNSEARKSTKSQTPKNQTIFFFWNSETTFVHQKSMF